MAWHSTIKRADKEELKRVFKKVSNIFAVRTSIRFSLRLVLLCQARWRTFHDSLGLCL